MFYSALTFCASLIGPVSSYKNSGNCVSTATTATSSVSNDTDLQRPSSSSSPSI